MGEFRGLFCIWVAGRLGETTRSVSLDHLCPGPVHLGWGKNTRTTASSPPLFILFNEPPVVATLQHLNAFLTGGAFIKNFHVEKLNAASVAPCEWFANIIILSENSFGFLGELTVNKWDHGGADALSSFCISHSSPAKQWRFKQHLPHLCRFPSKFLGSNHTELSCEQLQTNLRILRFCERK